MGENRNPFEAGCEEEIEWLMRRAQELVSLFWSRHFAVRDSAPYSEWGAYGVRARMVKGTLSIEWYRSRFYGPKGARQMRSEYLPKGKGDRYGIAKFRHAQEWERELIDQLEGQFAMLRRAARLLTEVRRRGQKYGEVVSALANVEEVAQEV